MTRWLKRLLGMVADPRPVSYTYAEAAAVLVGVGFELQPHQGSHRKFRKVIDDPKAPGGRRTVIIGLVEKGRGPLKPAYIRTMVRTLQENDLLPDGVE